MVLLLSDSDSDSRRCRCKGKVAELLAVSALLTPLLAPWGEAAIPTALWQQGTWVGHHERIWTKVADATAGQSADCRFLGSLALADPAAEFPWFCESRASFLGSDTFDVFQNLSRCDFKLCGAVKEMHYTAQHGGMSTYSRLVGGWKQVLRAVDGFGIGCTYLGSYRPGDGDPPLASCEWQAALLGGDAFDVRSDGKCYFKRCGSFADIQFSDLFGGYDSYTILGGKFLQVTRMQHGAGTDCPYLGSTDLDSGEDSQPNSTPPLLACVSKGMIMGADTFDWKPGKCYFKKCSTLQDMLFTDRFGPYETFTTLGRRWSQVTRAVDGYSANCTGLGSVNVSDPAEFAQECYSKATILGGDTLDVEADASRCYIQRCGALKDIRFTTSLGGRQTHTMLTGGWSSVTQARDGVGVGCRYVGDYTPPANDFSEFPYDCFSQAIIQGANAIDYRLDPPRKCYYKACERYGEFAFTEAFGGFDTFTLLFPRDGDSWGRCIPPDCLDVHLLWTGLLSGVHLPVGSSGSTCDPDDADTCFGGAARRVSYAQMKRAELAKTNESVVLLDLGGGTFGGPFWDHPKHPKGLANTLLQNQVPFDLCVFSPRDFLTQDDNVSRALMVQALGNRTCTFISSNARFAGAWAGFNSKTVPWAVVPTLNGAKVAFVSMFPHQSNYGYGFGNGVVELDSGGLSARLLAGSSGVRLRLSLETLMQKLQEVDTQYDLLEDHTRDVYVMSTVAPTDVLRAAGRARRAHPDIQAVVLLVSGSNRVDSTTWLAETGAFDIILGGREEDMEPQLIDVDGRQILLAGSKSLFGMGYARVRVKSDVGVERFEFMGDVPLDSTVPSDPPVQALMSELFQVNRERLARPYGNLTNPLTGGHRGQEAPPSMNQCYYMECPAGRVIGDALLWKARSEGHQVDVSLYNLGGLRAPLEGVGESRTVSVGHCTDTLKFQNVLKLYNILGRDLYETIKSYLKFQGVGTIGAGWRVAYYEPCHGYVDHSNFEEAVFRGNHPPGSEEEIERCRQDGVADVHIVMINVEVLHTDWSKCSDSSDYSTCTATEWRTLEKGATYTLASTDFVMSENSGFQPLDIGLGSDSVALCEYVASQGTVQVGSFDTYLQRGNVQYATAQDAWAAGLRVASVATSTSLLDSASTCPPGKHLPARARSCQDCPAGAHSEDVLVDGLTMPVCRQCPAGFFSDRPGMGACQACAPGRYMSDAGATDCLDCLPGFLSEAGAIRCTSCTPGFFSNGNGSSSCLGCPIGKYADGSQRSHCTSCPGSFVTRYPASTSADDCICDEGSFLQPGQGSCRKCGEGLLCNGGNEEPLQLAGYWVMTRTSGAASVRLLATAGNDNGVNANASALVNVTASAGSDHTDDLNYNDVTFTCRNNLECPEGPLGSCASGREGTACSSCRNHHYPVSNGTCLKCDTFSLLPALAFAVLLPLLPLGLVIFAKNDATTSHHTMVTVACIAGQMVMAVQALVAIQQVQVSFPSPLDELMEFISFFSLDLTYLRLPCLISSDNPVRLLVLKLLLYPFLVLLLLLLHCVSRLLKRPIESAVLFNANGWVLLILYITMALTVMLPFQCRRNPSGFLTMASNPGLKCFEDGEHQVLTGLAVVGTLVYPVGTLAWACYVTLTYKSKMLSAGGLSRLRKYRFLFGRYKPEVYFFGLLSLLRNSFVAVIPVALARLATIQVLFMGGVLMFGNLLQVWLMPWRTVLANLSDAMLGLLLSLTVLGIATLLGGDEVSEVGEGDQGASVGIAASVLIVLLFVVGFALISWAFYRRLFPKNRFAIFLCHHKAGAGALCRLMKLIIEPHTSVSIFLDSDHLEDLDTLFDIVRSRVSNLVVVMTKSVLTRPWCAGEIVTSHRNGIRIVPLLCPDFDPVTEEEMACIVEQWTQEELNTLLTHDITTEMVVTAFKHIMTLERIEMPRFECLVKKELATRNLMAACHLSVMNMDARASIPRTEQGARIIITGAVDDAEGLAACEIVQVMLQRKLEMEIAVVSDAAQASLHKSSASVLVVLLSEGLLMNEQFVKLLLEVFKDNALLMMNLLRLKEDDEGTDSLPASRTLADPWPASRSPGDIQFLTLNVNASFKFPPAEFYSKVEEEGLPLAGLGPENGHGSLISHVFRTMLSVVSKPFTPLGATAPLEVQMEDLGERVKRLLHSDKVQEEWARRTSNWAKITRLKTKTLAASSSAFEAISSPRVSWTSPRVSRSTGASRSSAASKEESEMIIDSSKWATETHLMLNLEETSEKVPQHSI